jgi:cullin 3
LNEELERVLNYLDSSSERILIQTFLKEYVETHAATLINMEHSGLIHMIKNEKYNEIQLMHDLFSKVPDAYTLLTKNLAQYIVNEGNKLVADE